MAGPAAFARKLERADKSRARLKHEHIARLRGIQRRLQVRTGGHSRGRGKRIRRDGDDYWK